MLILTQDHHKMKDDLLKELEYTQFFEIDYWDKRIQEEARNITKQDASLWLSNPCTQKILCELHEEICTNLRELTQRGRVFGDESKTQSEIADIVSMKGTIISTLMGVVDCIRDCKLTVYNQEDDQ